MCTEQKVRTLTKITYEKFCRNKIQNGRFLARLLIFIKKGGLLQLKFGVVGVNIYLWVR